MLKQVLSPAAAPSTAQRGSPWATPMWTMIATALLVGLAMLLTSSVRAQSVETLVKNTHLADGKGLDSGQSPNGYYGQRFTTGSNADGYELDSVGVQIDINNLSGSETITVRVHEFVEANTNDLGAEVTTLTTPTLVAGELNTFQAPANVTLKPSTSYIVNFHITGNIPTDLTLGATADNGEMGKDGWTIENASRQGGEPELESVGILIEVKGKVLQPDDPSLRDLQFQDSATNEAIDLNEDFDTDTTAYTATVEERVRQLTAMPTTTALAATVEYQDASNQTLTDDDSEADGFQIDLAVGENTVNVVVTSSDESETRTYTLTITRLPDSLLVGNTHLTGLEIVITGDLQNGQTGQRFTTGSAPNGYELTSVGINMARIAFTGEETTTVRIHEFEPDATNALGDLVTTLATPVLTSNRLNVFTAPPGVKLAPNTRYIVNFHSTGDSRDDLAIEADASNSEIGADGWSIENARRHEGALQSGAGLSLLIEVRGNDIGESNNANLSDLQLENSSTNEAISLNETFDRHDNEYSATVEEHVRQITVTPTTAASGATIEYLSSTDTELTDASRRTSGHQVNLDIGDNVFKVRVTSQDRTHRETYVVTVTRLDYTVLVRNTHLTRIGSLSIGDGRDGRAGQRFFTGDIFQRYVVTSVGAHIHVTNYTGSETVTARIHQFDDGATNDLGTLVATLETPTLQEGQVNFFTAPANTILEPYNHYILNFHSTGNTGSDLQVSNNSSNEEIGVAGWTIENAPRVDGTTFTTSSMLIEIRGRINPPTNATGMPEISGITRAYRTLTAGIGTIADPDGLPANFPNDYTFQWVRVDGDTETEISGATSHTYRLVDADVGKTVRVNVSFTDDLGNPEGPRQSAASLKVAGSLNDCIGSLTYADWCTFMTVGQNAESGLGFDRRTTLSNRTPKGSMSDRTINVGCSTYIIEAMILVTVGGTKYFLVETNKQLPKGSRFNIGGTDFQTDDASLGNPGRHPDTTILRWVAPGLSWELHDRIGITFNAPESRNPDGYCKPAVVGMSNLAESQDAARETTALFHYGQTFTTGTDDRGYALQGIGLVSTWNSGALAMRVAIRDVLSDGNPGNVRHVLRNPGAMNAGEVSLFQAPAGAFLEPDTTYMVSVEPVYLESGAYLGQEMEPQVINYSFMFTESDNTHARNGWSFGAQHQRGDSATVAWNGFGAWDDTDIGDWRRLRIGKPLLMGVYAEPYVPDLDPWPTLGDAAGREDADDYLSFTVTLSHTPSQTLTFKYSTSDGTARAGSDYADTSGTLILTPGVTFALINVPIFNDSIEDDNETLTLTLTDIYGTVLGVATGLIRNEESIENPLTASFDAMPDSHTGEAFTFTLNFSEDVTGLSAAKLRDHAFNVSNGSVTAAKQTNPDGDEPNRAWQITITPDADGPVTITLPETKDCNASSGICADEKPLSAQVSATIAGPAVWSATMTTGMVYQDYGYGNIEGVRSGALTSRTFEIEGETHTVRLVEASDWIYIGFDQELPAEFALTVDGDELESTDAVHASYSYADLYTWSAQDIYWSEGDRVKLALYVLDEEDEPSNSSATGAPTISGTPQVGQTLTADTTGVADADGLGDVSWNYQWARGDADIGGATSSTYTLVDYDQGKTIKVTASFTDDAGHPESLTSAPTAAVTLSVQEQQSNSPANSPATGAPTISGTAQVGQTLTADTSGISDADGLDDVSYGYLWVRNDGNDDTDISGATGGTYTLADDDQGKTIKVKVSFTDDAGHSEELTSAATGTVAARANRAAAGTPTITGTAQVGETLTAVTTGISDADGLTGVSYSYQWVRNDGNDDTDISGATAGTYTLADDDQGKTIKVKVSFTDDAGHSEELTSAATGTVAPSPLSAEFLLIPATHDGAAVFSFRISFSENLQNRSGRRIVEALSISGGTVQSANRVNKARDLFVVKVTPSGTGDITFSLDAFSGDCEDEEAICTADGRRLSNQNEATVIGPGS